MSFPMFDTERTAGTRKGEGQGEAQGQVMNAAFAPYAMFWQNWAMATQFWMDSMNRFAGNAGEPTLNVAPVHVVPLKAEPAVAERVEVAPVVAANDQPVQPAGLVAARDGAPDDLKMISGVGPKIERILHGLGIFHFDQVAAWTAREVQWVDNHLNFKGRAIREDWIAQADALATGGRDEYVKRFGKEPR